MATSTMNLKRLLLASGLILVLSGVLLACFTFGGWLNQPKAFAYKWHDTELAILNRLLGFVPYYEDTVLPLLGVGLMFAGALLIVVSAILWVMGIGYTNRTYPLTFPLDVGRGRGDSGNQGARCTEA